MTTTVLTEPAGHPASHWPYWPIVLRWTLGLVLLAGLSATLWGTTSDAAVATDLLVRLEPPSWSHPFGTDQFGRDVAVRVANGLTPTIAMSCLVLTLSTVLGTVLGLIAGHHPGSTRSVVMSTTDAFLAVPGVFVALAVTAAVGPGLTGLVTALVAVGWTPYCRLTYQLSTVVMETEFVEAARAVGMTEPAVVFRHVLPNIAGPILSGAAVRVANTMLSISALGYLGLGPQPPSADWGATLSAAQPYVERAPWVVAAPGIAILLSALCAIWAGRCIERRVSHR
jgi:peptide/nickel transport system permease protein